MSHDSVANVFFAYCLAVAVIEDGVDDCRVGAPVTEYCAAQFTSRISAEGAVFDFRSCKEVGRNCTTLECSGVAGQEAVSDEVSHISAVEINSAAGTINTLCDVVAESAILDCCVCIYTGQTATNVDTEVLIEGLDNTEIAGRNCDSVNAAAACSSVSAYI